MIFKCDVKEAGNASLGESSDVEVVLWVKFEEDEVAVGGWEDGLAVSIGALVETNP